MCKAKGRPPPGVPIPRDEAEANHYTAMGQLEMDPKLNKTSPRQRGRVSTYKMQQYPLSCVYLE